MEEFRWGCRVQTGWTEDWQALRPLVLTGADIPEDRPPGRVFSLAQATEQGVWAAALAAREYRADRIIAFGDGDVLSCGKLAAMASGRKLTARLTAAQLQDCLAGRRGMIPCGASYVVNLAHVRCFSGTDLVMDGGERIPVPRRLRAQIKQAYFDFYLEEVKNG